MNNVIYRFNKFIDNRSNGLILTLILLVAFGQIFLLISEQNIFFIIPSICIWLFLGIIAIFRLRYVNGDLKFDTSKYILPNTNDEIVFTKKIYYDPYNGTLLKKRGKKSGKGLFEITPGTIGFIIDSPIPTNGDWMLQVKLKNIEFNNSIADFTIIVDYLKFKKYWQTKSDIRNNKLYKLGI